MIASPQFAEQYSSGQMVAGEIQSVTDS